MSNLENEMTKEAGVWRRKNGDRLFTVIVEGVRQLAWARGLEDAKETVMWERFTRRNRKAPLAVEVRPADDDEAATLLRRKAASTTPGPATPSLLDGIAPDPALTALLDNGGGLVRRDAPSTSRKAARKVQIGTMRHRILAMIVAAGDAGLTDEEMQVRFTANSQRPRRVELHDAHLIKVADDGCRETQSGYLATVWVATDEGRRVLDVCGPAPDPA